MNYRTSQPGSLHLREEPLRIFKLSVLVRSPPIENVHTQTYRIFNENTGDSVAMYLSTTT
jgi:hypothetical protein